MGWEGEMKRRDASGGAGEGCDVGGMGWVGRRAGAAWVCRSSVKLQGWACARLTANDGWTGFEQVRVRVRKE